jgi:hypothetical protein
MEAGLFSSRVEEVVEPPAPTPIFTIVGGPSRAPVRSAAPVSVASLRLSGITYSKAVTLPMQSMSGLSSSQALLDFKTFRLKRLTVQTFSVFVRMQRIRLCYLRSEHKV